MSEESKKKRNSRQQRWIDQNRDRINLLFSRGTKDKVQKAADCAGLSKSQWIEKAIIEKLERDLQEQA